MIRRVKQFIQDMWYLLVNVKGRNTSIERVQDSEHDLDDDVWILDHNEKMYPSLHQYCRKEFVVLFGKPYKITKIGRNMRYHWALSYQGMQFVVSISRPKTTYGTRIDSYKDTKAQLKTAYEFMDKLEELVHDARKLIATKKEAPK